MVRNGAARHRHANGADVRETDVQILTWSAEMRGLRRAEMPRVAHS